MAGNSFCVVNSVLVYHKVNSRRIAIVNIQKEITVSLLLKNAGIFSKIIQTKINLSALAVFRENKPAVKLASFCVNGECGIIAIYQNRKRKRMNFAKIDIESGKITKYRETIFKKVKIYFYLSCYFYFRKLFKNALFFIKVSFALVNTQKCSFLSFL